MRWEAAETAVRSSPEKALEADGNEYGLPCLLSHRKALSRKSGPDLAQGLPLEVKLIEARKFPQCFYTVFFGSGL